MRFRGITVREALIDGPLGLGRVSAFWSTNRRRPPTAGFLTAICRRRSLLLLREAILINATVPAIAPDQVLRGAGLLPGDGEGEGGRAGIRPTMGQACRARTDPTVRVDANGGWICGAGRRRCPCADSRGELEYLEATLPHRRGAAEVRRLTDVPVAADESIRKADDPLAVVRAKAADIAVLKVVLIGAGCATWTSLPRSTSRW